MDYTRRVRERLRSYSLTPVGRLLLLLLIASIVVIAVGPHHDQKPAFVVLVLAALAIVVPFGGMGRRADLGRPLAQRREEFHPIDRQVREEESSAEQDRLWAAERERHLSGD